MINPWKRTVWAKMLISVSQVLISHIDAREGWQMKFPSYRWGSWSTLKNLIHSFQMVELRASDFNPNIICGLRIFSCGLFKLLIKSRSKVFKYSILTYWILLISWYVPRKKKTNTSLWGKQLALGGIKPSPDPVHRGGDLLLIPFNYPTNLFFLLDVFWLWLMLGV